MITPTLVAILLTQGKYALVRNDFAHLADLRWCARKAPNTFYATRRERHPDGAWGNQWLHRLIIEEILGYPIPPGIEVDHVDGNGLNNLPDNLRLATKTENQWNVGLRTDNTSGYTGVYWKKDRNKWGAEIKFNGKRKHLGYFDTAEEAHRAYCEAARKYHGEFARCD